MEKLTCDDFIFFAVLLLTAVVTFSTGASSVAVGIGAAALIYKIVREKKIPPIPDEILKLFFVYLSLEFMIAFGSIDFLHSIREFFGEIHRLLPFVFALMVIKNRRHMIFFAVAFLISCYVNDVYSLYQRYNEIYELYYGRVTGFLHNPNMLANFQLAQFPMLIFFIVRKEFPRWIKILSIVASLEKILVLIFTLTRGAWISAIIVGITFVILDRNAWKFLGVAIFILGGIFFSSATLQDRFESLSTMDFGSARERKLMWQSSINMIIDYPLHGVGQEMFGRIYNDRYISPDAWERPDPNSKGHTHPHNNFLKAATEGGLIGIAAFVILHGYFLKQAWKFYREDRRNFIGTILILLIIGLQLGGITETNLNQTPILREYWLSIGFLFAVKNFSCDDTSETEKILD